MTESKEPSDYGESKEPKESKELKAAPPLPANINDWHRQIKAERSFNDLVEEIHRSLVSNEEYRSYLQPVHDEHAKEGKIVYDNCMAAVMIRDKAKETGVDRVVKENLAVIVKSLNVSLTRYGVSKKQRRRMLGGEEVPDNGND